MQFHLLPTLDTMYNLYLKPRNVQRFREDYLRLLQGERNADMIMPIGQWNPMAKEHILGKISALQKLNAEPYVAEILKGINREQPSLQDDRNIGVSICIADDLMGGWTNRFTTDYDNRFKINALIQRNFCTPLFWSGEDYDVDKIRTRTLEACYRTLYWLSHSKPLTLADHLQQELFVAQKSGLTLAKKGRETLTAFYELHKNKADYPLIFSYFYGDEACRSLNFPIFGLEQGWLQSPYQI